MALVSSSIDGAKAPYLRGTVLFGRDGFSLSLICEVERLCIKEEDEAEAVVSKRFSFVWIRWL
jgi:hypothetical protein